MKTMRLTKTFFNLIDAYVFRAQCDVQNLRIWPYQHDIDNKGSRRYFMALEDDFWQYYSNLRDSLKCYDELIEPDRPCRLYLDLEFDKTLNPDIDPTVVSRLLEQWLCNNIKTILGITVDRKLESRSKLFPTKWSQHWIYELPVNACFASNSGIRHFLENSVNYKLPSQVTACSALSGLVVEGKKGKKWIFDMGVYDKNRCLRIYKANKLTDDNPLLPIEMDLTFPEGKPREWVIFQRSLVCMSSGHRFSIVCTDKLRRNQLFNTSLHNFHGLTNGSDVLIAHGYARRVYSRFYQFLEKYLFLVSRPGMLSKIGKIKLIKNQLILFSLTGETTYCFNKGDFHITNHNYFIYDPEKQQFWQSCHDSECKKVKYKTPPTSVPNSLNFTLDSLDWPFCGVVVPGKDKTIAYVDLTGDDDIPTLACTSASVPEQGTNSIATVQEDDIDFDDGLLSVEQMDRIQQQLDANGENHNNSSYFEDDFYDQDLTMQDFLAVEQELTNVI